MKLLLSVVVPFYNSEFFLRKCVQSILNQSFQNFELILVDDGSTDGSRRLSDELEINYNNVCVIHHDRNRGLLAARQTGANVAKGHYLTFVDSDDYIDVDYFEKFANVISRYPDIDVICGGCVVDYGFKSKMFAPEFKDGLYIGESKLYLNKRFFSYPNSVETRIWPTVWSKWYKREHVLPLIIRADKRITYAEDLIVSYFAIILAESVYVLTNATGYHYVQHPSMMTRNYPDDYFSRIQYFCEYVDITINGLKLEEYQSQFDRHKLLMYKRGFDVLISRKDKLQLISDAAESRAFRDIFKSISLFRVRGLSLVAKLRIWMIYHHMVSLSYIILSLYIWIYKRLHWYPY